MNENFYATLHAIGVRHADAPCLVQPGGPAWRYGALDRLSARFARVLQDSGVTAGERVLVQLEKTPEAVALYLACLRTGAIYVPLNTAYTADEVEYFRADAEPFVVCCAPQGAAAMRAVCGPARLLTLGVDAQGEASGTLADAARRAAPLDGIADRAADDVAAILYTSGTTGRSKGAMLTHRNLATNAAVLCDYWGWRSSDVLIHALPIFHVHGLFVALHCAMLHGSSMIFLSGFDADAIVRAFADATVLMGVPTFYTRLLQHPALDAARVARMRLFVSGSAPLTVQTFEAWEARTGHRILERYGMSETLMNTSNPLDGERVAGTVGFALPGVECRICDASGAVLPANDIGEIEVRGANVFRGYWRMPDVADEAFRPDGYFRTGDLGQMDASGRLTIVGRSKDLVITGGYNVYPKEIELLIDTVLGVEESAVFGVPHPDFGEAVVAAVVAQPASGVDAHAVMSALAPRLARFKQPKHIVFVDALPRNAMGKVQKNTLRARYGDVFC
jgi:malonyl-CoA/methylmalonyl-CoA synthetase